VHFLSGRRDREGRKKVRGAPRLYVVGKESVAVPCNVGKRRSEEEKGKEKGKKVFPAATLVEGPTSENCTRQTPACPGLGVRKRRRRGCLDAHRRTYYSPRHRICSSDHCALARGERREVKLIPSQAGIQQQRRGSEPGSLLSPPSRRRVANERKRGKERGGDWKGYDADHELFCPVASGPV